MLVLNDQAQDVVRVLGEEPDWRIFWLAAATLAGAGHRLVVGARDVLFPISHRRLRARTSFPGSRSICRATRRVGDGSGRARAVPGLAQLRRLAAGPAGRLRLLALAFLFLGLAAGFVYLTAKRRGWLAAARGPRPSGLRSLSELHWQAWLPLAWRGLSVSG